MFFTTYIVLFSRDRGGNISDVHVTNITTNSFTILWQTEIPTFSEVIVSENDQFLELFPRQSSDYNGFYDDTETIQDENGKWVLDPSNRTRKNIHHVTVRNLEPNKQYYFRILGDFKVFSFDKSVNTFSLEENLQNPHPIYGLALNYSEAENFANEGVVVFTIRNGEIESQKISSIINSQNGGWQYDLSKIRSVSGQEMSFTKDISSKLEFYVLTNIYEGNGFGDLSAYQPVGTLFYGVFYGE